MKKFQQNRISLLAVLILSLASFLNAEYGPSQKSDDAFREMEGFLTLWFFNALNGEEIPGAVVNITVVGEYTTDPEGKAVFEIPLDGHYSVVFSREGFITTQFEIEVMAGTLFFNLFSVSPVMPIGNMRVVLDWGDNPRDLDAHLVKRDSYHISYRNMRVSDDEVSRLDRDDTDGYGPETITSNHVDENAVYQFFVHDYTNKNMRESRSLSDSKACVKVYEGDRLLNIFQVPLDKKGTYWHVFNIQNSQVVEVNNISNSEPGR